MSDDSKKFVHTIRSELVYRFNWGGPSPAVLIFVEGLSNRKSPGIVRGFFCARANLTLQTSECRPSLLPWGRESVTLATGARQPHQRSREKDHAQLAFDRWFPRARVWPALDRSGHRRDRLAGIELHDQPDSSGPATARRWPRSA